MKLKFNAEKKYSIIKLSACETGATEKYRANTHTHTLVGLKMFKTLANGISLSLLIEN